jgi:hypothetical protein
MKYLLILVLVMSLMACGDASRLTEPNTYRKCSEYSIKPIVTHTLDFGTEITERDTAYIMRYGDRSVTLTDAQAARLETDPTGVCREVM